MSTQIDLLSGRALFELADGSRLEAAIHRSQRARALRLRLAPDDTLSLSVPAHWPEHMVMEKLPDFLPWLEHVWHKQQKASPAPCLPDVITFPFMKRAFRVQQAGDWKQGRTRSPHAMKALSFCRADQRSILLEETEQVLLFGSDDKILAAHALCCWARGKAAESLPPYVFSLAQAHAFPLSKVSIRDQRTRWGSCTYHIHKNTSEGRIQLNWRALLLPSALLTHLVWHELCHLRHMDHSQAYREELARFSPDWSRQEKALTHFWRTLPWWALPRRKP